MATLRLQGLIVVTVLALATVAFADGCYIPERAVQKIPEIPAQRAALFWKDGQGTLIISSALDSQSQKLGWIIPLPAVPTKIEKETPGALKTLDFCIQPKITHELYGELRAALIVAFLGNLLLGTYLFKRERFVKVLVVTFIVCLLYSLMLPATMLAGAKANVQVEKTVAVGVYDVSVLRPKQFDDLNAWLAENGFAALPTAAGATVADYIANNWVFAAIKLTRAAPGKNAPHPIRMTFPAKEAVYPLKLTALAGKSTSFEIFVIADDRAACKPLDAIFCDRFSKTNEDCFAGATTNQKIGHPAVCPLMWDKCVLTKFAGSIDAGDMTSDIRFAWKPFQPYQQHWFTWHGSWQFTLLLFVSLAGGWGFCSMVACANKIDQSSSRKWYFFRVLLPGVALSAAVAGIVLVCLPRIAASEVVVGSLRWQSSFAASLRFEVEDALKEQPPILRGAQDDIAAWLLKSFGKMQNGTTGTDLAVEDSPGNFTVEKQSKKVVVRVYDDIGRPTAIEQPIDEPQKGRAGG